MKFLICLVAAIAIVGIIDVVFEVIVMKFGEAVGLVIVILAVAGVLYFDVRRGL